MCDIDKEIFMKKKLLIGAILFIGSCTVTTFGASAYLLKGCNYNQVTGNYIKDGKEYAFGAMEDAMACAMYGMLPQIVTDRLGILGDVESNMTATTIKLIDSNVRKSKERVANK